MTYSNDVSFNEASRILDYNHSNGEIRYKVDRACGKYRAGTLAGSINAGYLAIGINKKYYKAHRIAWLLHYGKWPDRNIDHINRDKTDNRIENLRLCTQSQNIINSGMFKHNTSGTRGVSFRSDRKGKKNWIAHISNQKKKLLLGYFYTKNEAAKARAEAEARLFGRFSTLA